MKLRPDSEPRQQIFLLQANVLSCLQRPDVERWRKVFDQAYVNRAFCSESAPMLPTRPDRGWKQDRTTEARQALLNTYQTAAFAYDIGVPRCRLALDFNGFRQFMLYAREAVRLFDIRIGPPWWIRDRDFLEMVYTAVMAQEEQCTDWLADSLSCYWGMEGVRDTPQWMAESFFDTEHSNSANIIEQCRWHYYEADGKTVKPGKDPMEAKLSMLLNWQVIWQPHFALQGTDIQGSYRARTAFPHRAEERRLIGLLNAMPRGRPQKVLHAAHA